MAEAYNTSRNSSDYELYNKVTIPKPFSTDVAEYIENADEFVAEGKKIIAQVLKGEEYDNLDLRPRHIPAIVATTLDMRERVSSSMNLDVHKATLVHRLAGVSFRMIANNLYKYNLTQKKLIPSSLMQNFGNSFFNVAIRKYEHRPEARRHPAGRVGLLADYIQSIDSGDTQVIWTPLTERSPANPEREGLISDKGGVVREVDMYAHVMAGRFMEITQLKNAVDDLVGNLVKTHNLMPEEASLLKKRMFGEDQSDVKDQIRSMLDRLDKIVGPRTPNMQERDPHKQEIVGAMKKIMAAFIRGGQPIRMIQARIAHDKNAASRSSVYRSIEPEQTMQLLAGGLQRAFHTEPEKRDTFRI